MFFSRERFFFAGNEGRPSIWMSPIVVIVVLWMSAGAALGFEFSPSSEPNADALESQVSLENLEKYPLSPRSPLAASETLFEALSPERTGVSFQMRVPDIAMRFREVLQLATLGGICTGDFNGDGLTDFYATSPIGGGRLYLNRNGFHFEDITEASGLSDPAFWNSGATAVDIDNDGDLDLYLCGYRMPNRLYVNEGLESGGVPHFVERAEQFGLAYNGGSMSMVFADFDRDGDLDGYLATTAVPPPPGVRFHVRYEGNKPVVPEELREYWDLLYLPDDRAHLMENGQYDHFFRNDDGLFVDVTKEAGIEGPYLTLGAIAWDFNADGWPDLYVANDYLGPDRLYLNQRDGTFKEVIQDAIPHTPWSSMGMDIGDLNNDGRIDLIACDMLGTTHYRRNVMLGESSQKNWFLELAEPRQYSRNAVYLNTGSGRMMEVAYQTGFAATDWTWAPRIEDFDNDGRVDVFFCNGVLRDVQHADLVNYAKDNFKLGSKQWTEFWSQRDVQKEANLAFRNQGDLRFENVSAQWGLNRSGVSFGAATADFDNDGDLDLVVNNADAPVSILRNRSGSGNSARIQLHGTASNRFGIGATIRLKAGGREQARYVAVTRGWLSGSEPVTHFGLGDADAIDQLSVEWPSGRRQTFVHLPVNRLLRITEPETGEAEMSLLASEKTAHSFFAASDLLDQIQDQGSKVDDFQAQPLLPRRISRTRYCMAWGDMDQDGDADLFLGGGPGEAGRIFFQNLHGFSEIKFPAFVANRESTDTAAIFLDADSDGDLDLFVVSGGYRPPSDERLLRNHLYLNNGKGEFSAAPETATPNRGEAGSCVAAADFDRDGDLDLFIGGGPVPGKYPLSAPGRLLVNDNGSFADKTPSAFQNIGLATDALWSDATGDGWPDLLITTEWGPVRLFVNEAGTLRERTDEAGLANLLGWWNAIAGGDVDQDGDVDYVVGNLGLNTRYHATPEEPELLFYGDFGGAGQPRLIEAYYENGRRYPRCGLDDLSRAMPFLRGKFLNFHQFSSATLEEVFSPEMLKAARRFEANTLESGILVNLGEARFEFTPLPALAQTAPINDLALDDFDGDGRLDLVIAQNDFSPQPLTGRMDGGLSLLLLGNGKGGFDSVWPSESGIVVPHEARCLAAVDLNGDERLDLVFGTPGEPIRAFIRQGDGK